ncbi:MAG: hypothetical protein PHN74_02020 [Candidatus Pacebacteria bacterium]|nr:hypothetical protein [Candidatus Paceibacterota bacterium]
MKLDSRAKLFVARANAELLKRYPVLVGDAVVVSSALVKSDWLTSVSVEQFEVTFCDLKNGTEELGLPDGIPFEEFAQLKDCVIPAGASVKQGDILVARVVPNSNHLMNMEERLLVAIFGKKAESMRDGSLVYPLRDPGVVTRVKVMARYNYHCSGCNGNFLSASPQTKCKLCGNKKIRDERGKNELAITENLKIQVEVLVRRELKIGDVLSDDYGHKFVVACIEDEYKMPRFNGKEVSVIARLDTLNFMMHENGFFSAMSDSGRRKKLAGKSCGDFVKLQKNTRRSEEKFIARGTGASNIFDMPLAVEEARPPQKLNLAKVLAMFKLGYRQNLREALFHKADDGVSRKQSYENLIRGNAVSGKTNEALSVLRLFSLLKSCCMNAKAENGEIKFSLARTDQILKWSYGEVKNPDTLDYRTYKPERHGLLCESIFGPMRDMECSCGRYKFARHKGIVCDRCGVEIVESKVRRERFGHIVLPKPIVHPWLAEELAKRLGIAEERFLSLMILEQGDTLMKILKEQKINPSEYFIDVLPVLPADLRPLFPIEGGRFATADLNDLYRRVINRVLVLKRCVDLKAPMIMKENEYRLLYNCVAHLFDNSGEGCVTGEGNRRLKSITDELADITETMFSKRVNFSARGIAIPDPTVEKGKVKLPYRMALELFAPKVIAQSVFLGSTITKVKQAILRKPFDEKIVKAAEQAIDGHPVLLITDQNNIGGFLPVISDNKEDEAIRLHPEDAAKLKINFVGQKPVQIHVPLSEEAKKEAINPLGAEQKDMMPFSLDRKGIVEHLLARTSVKLTDLDKIALGIS